MSQFTFEVTDANFQDEVIKSKLPVLIDFWAEWCGPCKMIAPIVDDLAQKYNGKLRVGKLDVDSNGSVPELFDVQGIPTLILFKGGQVAAEKVGALSKSQLTAFIDSHL